MKFCFKPARNFRTVEPFNSFLPPTPRKPANWTKHVGDYAGRFSSIRGLPSWRKPIQIWSRFETIEQEFRSSGVQEFRSSGASQRADARENFRNNRRRATALLQRSYY